MDARTQAADWHQKGSRRMPPLERAQFDLLAGLLNPTALFEHVGCGWTLVALRGQPWEALRQPLAMNPGQMNAAVLVYRWHWRAKLPERHGQLCVVLVHGKMNSCLVEFLSDGFRVITSRNALRRAHTR